MRLLTLAGQPLGSDIVELPVANHLPASRGKRSERS